MSIRLRLPDELADRLRRRATRGGVASSVAMALKILQDHVDADLPPGQVPASAQFRVPSAGDGR